MNEVKAVDLDELVSVLGDDREWYEREGIPVSTSENGRVLVPRWARYLDARILSGPLARAAIRAAAKSVEVRTALSLVSGDDVAVRAYLVSIGVFVP